MKSATIAVLLYGLGYAHTEAHCFTVWNYPSPQHCGVSTDGPRRHLVFNNLHTSVPVPTHIHDVLEIPLPDMSANWGGAMDSELELQMQRQKAIKSLSSEK